MTISNGKADILSLFLKLLEVNYESISTTIEVNIHTDLQFLYIRVVFVDWPKKSNLEIRDLRSGYGSKYEIMIGFRI